MRYITLNDGNKMPILGFGVFQIPDPAVCERTVLDALEIGYRSIDTAQSYKNEEAVGNAIKRSGLKRDDIFVTTKLKIANLTYERAISSFYESLDKLGLDHVDLLLIHHPYHDVFGAWRAMRELRSQKLVRSIGLSNFPPDRLEDMILHGGELPALMQLELHPYNTRKSSLEIMQKHGITAEAWGPLAQGKMNIFNDRTLLSIAAEHGKSVAQIILRWLVQQDIIVIPKSVHKERLAENFDIFDFALTDEHMRAISALNRDESAMPQMGEPFWVDTLSSY